MSEKTIILLLLGFFLLVPITDAITGDIWNQETASAAFPARSYFPSLVFDNKMWVIGGSQYTSRLNDTYSSTDGITWTLVNASAAFPARGVHSAVVFNNKMWIFGGDGNEDQRDIWSSSDGKIWTQVNASPEMAPVRYYSTAVFNNKIWAIGGVEGASTFKNTVWSSNDGNVWTIVNASPAFSGRYGSSILIYNNKMWIIGGIGLGTYSNDTWSSPDGNIWTCVNSTSAFPGRGLHSGVVANNKMWIIGGASSLTKGYNDIWSSTDGEIWTLVNNDPAFSKRSAHSSLVYNNKIWVIGGHIDGFYLLSSERNDVWSSSLSSGTSTPVAAFSGIPTSGYSPVTVTFTDNSINSPTSWIWSFGDEDITNSTKQNPVHTYWNAGTYTVSLTATNTGGSTTKTITDYVTVTDPPSSTGEISFYNLIKSILGLENYVDAAELDKIKISESLQITPSLSGAKLYYEPGEVITATVKIRNDGTSAVRLKKFLVGGRYNVYTSQEGKLPNGNYPDFPLASQQEIILQPNEERAYSQQYTLNNPGDYHFFVTYYNSETNLWNCNIDRESDQLIRDVDLYVKDVSNSPKSPTLTYPIDDEIVIFKTPPFSWIDNEDPAPYYSIAIYNEKTFSREFLYTVQYCPETANPAKKCIPDPNFPKDYYFGEEAFTTPSNNALTPGDKYRWYIQPFKVINNRQIWGTTSSGLFIISPQANNYLLGVDVSHYQSFPKGGSWDTVERQGYSFVLVKSTTGATGNIQDTTEEYYLGAKKENLVTGIYHFGCLDEEEASSLTAVEMEAKREVTSFITQNKKYLRINDLTPGLDVEEDNTDCRGNKILLANPELLQKWISTWSDELYNQKGIRPIIYASASTISQGSKDWTYDIWVSRYSLAALSNEPFNPGDPPKQYSSWKGVPWRKSWDFWQFTRSGNIVGGPQNSAGYVDINIFSGSIDDLKSGYTITQLKQSSSFENVISSSDGGQKITIDKTKNGVSANENSITIAGNAASESGFSSIKITMKDDGQTKNDANSFSGNVDTVKAETNPQSVYFDDTKGKVESNIILNMDNTLPPTAHLTTSISETPTNDQATKFQLQATAEGKKSTVAYILSIEKTGFSVSSAEIVMKVGKEWVDANGGKDAIKIFRIKDDGTTEALPTKCDDPPIDNIYTFRGTSGGFSTFGLVALAPADSSATSTGISGGSSDPPTPNQKSTSQLVSPDPSSGPWTTYQMTGQTHISQVSVQTINAIKDLFIVSEKVNSLPQGLPYPGARVYEYQKIEVYHATEDDINQGVIEFTVSESWLTEQKMTFRDIQLLRYHDNVWEKLSTEYVGMKNGEYIFKATTEGFSYFATALIKNATIIPETTSQTTESVPAPSSTISAEKITPQPTGTQTMAAPMNPEVPKETGSPIPLFAVGIVGIVLCVSGFFARSWWTRRQNPALFRDEPYFRWWKGKR